MTDKETLILAKEFAVEIFERHYNAEKIIMDNEAAKNASLVTIDYLLDQIRFYGFDSGKYSLLLLTETRQHLMYI